MPGSEVFAEVSLEIRERARGRYEVRLVREEGQAEVTEPFVPPFDARRLQSILNRFDRRPAKDARRRAQPPGPSGTEVGSALFEALFPDRIRRLFDLSRAGVDTVRPDGKLQGMRLRLRLDLEKERMRPLAALPWELLYDPLSRDFYGQGRLLLLVRHLAAPEPARALAVTPPLRILAVAASPEGLHKLDLNQEIQNLRDVLAGNDRLQVTVLPAATRDGLRLALRRERPHILHFLGHGQFSQETGEGFLYFQTPDGISDPVGGEQLARLIKEFPHVRLVVLNACRTAQMARSQGRTPFTSTGAALSLAGIPAVVAMQFKISDPGAIRFSKVFYESLADGDSVDVAVGEGRREIYNLWYRSASVEWAAPVLFLRAKDGQLFDLPDRTEPPSAPIEQKGEPVATLEAPQEEPQVLGIRSREPLGYRPDPTLDLTRHFDGWPIRDPSLWRTAVLPELNDFLRPVLTSRRPLLLDFAAHASIAFAAGWVLEAKSGLDVAVRQRLPKGFKDWNPDDAPLPEGPFWKAEDDQILDETAADVAVAVSLTRPVLNDVRLYIQEARLPVRRLLPATVAPEPGNTAIHSGAHTLELAQSLIRRIWARTAEERRGTLHLFISGPNAFLFYLGQLAHGLGRIQSYEFDFEKGTPGGYRPGIVLG